MKKIEVKASKTYPVFIDSNLIGDAGKFIKEVVSPKMSVHSTLITVFGLKRNEYSSAFTNVITLDDLFS